MTRPFANVHQLNAPTRDPVHRLERHLAGREPADQRGGGELSLGRPAGAVRGAGRGHRPAGPGPGAHKWATAGRWSAGTGARPAAGRRTRQAGAWR